MSRSRIGDNCPRCLEAESQVYATDALVDAMNEFGVPFTDVVDLIETPTGQTFIETLGCLARRRSEGNDGSLCYEHRPEDPRID